MMYKAKVAVCSEIRTKHSTQSEHYVQGISLARGPKLLSIKNYVIEITT